MAEPDSRCFIKAELKTALLWQWKIENSQLPLKALKQVSPPKKPILQSGFPLKVGQANYVLLS